MNNLIKNRSLTKLTVAGTETVWLISANDLLLGDVVYLTAANDWSRVLSEASYNRDKPVVDSQLEVLATDQSTVLGHALVEANLLEDGSLSLSHYRDRIRLGGPTHYG